VATYKLSPFSPCGIKTRQNFASTLFTHRRLIHTNFPLPLFHSFLSSLEKDFVHCSFILVVVDSVPKCELSREIVEANMRRNNITQVLTSTSFSGIYNAMSEVNTHLSIPEKLWATWYAWWRNDTLATGPYPNQSPHAHAKTNF